MESIAFKYRVAHHAAKPTSTILVECNIISDLFVLGKMLKGLKVHATTDRKQIRHATLKVIAASHRPRCPPAPVSRASRRAPRHAEPMSQISGCPTRPEVPAPYIGFDPYVNLFPHMGRSADIRFNGHSRLVRCHLQHNVTFRMGCTEVTRWRRGQYGEP